MVYERHKSIAFLNYVALRIPLEHHYAMVCYCETGGHSMDISSNQLIFSLSYISVQRVVDRLEQTYIESHHTISLFEDRITTSSRTFLMKHVFDVSYKPFSGQTGLFYLHTREGVFAFEIIDEPEKFISLFKQIQST